MLPMKYENMTNADLFQAFVSVYGEKLQLTARDTPYDPVCTFHPLHPDDIEWDLIDMWGILVDDMPVPEEKSKNPFTHINDDLKSRIYSRIAPTYRLPDSYTAFNQLYTGFGEIENVMRSTAVLMPNLADKGENGHFNTDIYFQDYFEMFNDTKSAANGYGSLYMNMNPLSECFGYIYSFTSSDDGHSGLVASSFTHLLVKMLNKVITCESICDCLNQRFCDCL